MTEIQFLIFSARHHALPPVFLNGGGFFKFGAQHLVYAEDGSARN